MDHCCATCHGFLYKGARCLHCGANAHVDCLEAGLCVTCVNKHSELKQLVDEGRVRTLWKDPLNKNSSGFYCVSQLSLASDSMVSVSWNGYQDHDNTLLKSNQLHFYPFGTCLEQECPGHCEDGTWTNDTFDSVCWMCNADMEGRPAACCEYTLDELCTKVCCRPCTTKQWRGSIPDKYYCDIHKEKMDNIKEPLRVLSLCSGLMVDLLAMLLNQYEVEVYVFVDVDDSTRQAAEYFKKNHPTINIVMWENVESARKHIEELDDQYNFNCVIGGTPCQPLSRANNFGAGFNDPRGRLFFYLTNIIHYLKKCKPRRYLLTIWENVVSSNANKEIASKELANIGMKIVEVDAKDWSFVRRKRLFGINHDIDEALLRAENTPSSIKRISSLKDIIADPKTTKVIDGKKYGNCFMTVSRDNHVFCSKKNSKQTREFSISEAIKSQYLEELELEKQDFSKHVLHGLVGNSINAAVLATIFKTQEHKIARSKKWLLIHHSVGNKRKRQ